MGPSDRLDPQLILAASAENCRTAREVIAESYAVAVESRVIVARSRDLVIKTRERRAGSRQVWGRKESGP
jgi:hypothetical protein